MAESQAGGTAATPAANTLRNALFIMCDQLRWDYLSCYGHPSLSTPNLDALATRGVRFERAYVQGPVCGPSRMSYYTGRYVTSHGSIWNFVPLRLGEWTLGHFMRAAGIRCGLIGKTHIVPDRDGIQKIGIDPDSAEGRAFRNAGFEGALRDDGVWPTALVDDGASPYTRYLREIGYAGANPWHDFANAGLGPDGELLSGWHMRNAGVAARVAPEHSESRWATDRALDFIAEQGAERWCLHLSYIKPHWPYIAPAPYHKMYGREDMLDVIRSPKELEDAHPVVAGFRNFKPSVSFQREGVRETVVPTYMGLVREIDDQIGRLLEALRASGRLDDTLVVFCSDHGDYLGDHYLGDKELFHDTVARVPMLVVDPRRAADATRGSASDRLVEAIDVVPTILDALGLPIADHIVEGRSLVPVLEASPGPWRDAAISEMTYAFRDVVRLPIGRPVSGCQSYMVRTGRWKANFYGGLRPELFDMSEDPHELHDLGGDPSRAGVIAELETLLVDWTRERNIHPTMPNATIAGWNKKEVEVGIEIGTW